MCYVTIDDIQFADDFYIDYDDAPRRIQKKMDRLVGMILELRGLPKSVNPHPSYLHGLWIGYITVGNQAWRMLYEYDEDTNIMTVCRLMTHNDMDKYL